MEGLFNYVKAGMEKAGGQHFPTLQEWLIHRHHLVAVGWALQAYQQSRSWWHETILSSQGGQGMI